MEEEPSSECMGKGDGEGNRGRAMAHEIVEGATANENVEGATANENVERTTANENVAGAMANEIVEGATVSEYVAMEGAMLRETAVTASLVYH